MAIPNNKAAASAIVGIYRLGNVESFKAFATAYNG